MNMSSAVTAVHRPKFHFVAVEWGGTQRGDRRRAELANAQARSHAARISYRRFKEPALVIKKPRAPVKRSVEDDLSSGDSPPLPVAVSTTNSSLDPFIRLAMEVPLEERAMIHEC